MAASVPGLRVIRNIQKFLKLLSDMLGQPAFLLVAGITHVSSSYISRRPDQTLTTFVALIDLPPSLLR